MKSPVQVTLWSTTIMPTARGQSACPTPASSPWSSWTFSWRTTRDAISILWPCLTARQSPTATWETTVGPISPHGLSPLPTTFWWPSNLTLTSEGAASRPTTTQVGKSGELNLKTVKMLKLLTSSNPYWISSLEKHDLGKSPLKSDRTVHGEDS